MRNAHASVNAVLIKGKVSICCDGACSKVVHTCFLVLVLSLAFASLLWTIPKQLPTSPGIFQNAGKIVARGAFGKCVWQTDSDIYVILCIAVCISGFSFRSFSLPMLAPPGKRLVRWLQYPPLGARFSKVPIINGPGELLLFKFKIEVSIVLQIIW